MGLSPNRATKNQWLDWLIKPKNLKKKDGLNYDNKKRIRRNGDKYKS